MRPWKEDILWSWKEQHKGFYKYTKSKLNSIASIADIKRPDGSTTQSDIEKENALNKFVGSVFTKEDVNNIPTSEERQMASFLTEIHLIEDNLCMKLEKLKPKKSLGPDGTSSRVW